MRSLVELRGLIKQVAASLPKLTLPTQILIGRRDDRVRFSAATALFLQIPSESRCLLHLPHAQHVMTFGADDDIAIGAVARFMSAHAAGRSGGQARNPHSC